MFTIREDKETGYVEIDVPCLGRTILVQAWYQAPHDHEIRVRLCDGRMRGGNAISIPNALTANEAELVALAIIQAVALAKAEQFRLRVGPRQLALYEENKKEYSPGEQHGLSDGNFAITYGSIG